MEKTMDFNELFAEQLKISAPLDKDKYNELSNTGKTKHKIGDNSVAFIICTRTGEELHYTLEFTGLSYAKKYIVDNNLQFVEYRSAAPVLATPDVISFIKIT